mmetsp:Transcript_8856/g.18923  ORF Transcript_8856/g.18923 Transcript_8856/m.18923 type:complete len:269 (+) Transcript_8856:108-914(+)|eukprot:CAMPEP_0202905496 /NCGR_PEP_ID=MMETSP1392-20130828/34541_1 /ASSEMBLY_ACC=CAM_ASM_000868 /TAXON_ID=225041 /ORGANISM="Chlamydomonas chlamydogama, Strain SAG 11-48b" /LENGTH=268 /DNA_ID=CAMNT_0049593597 /DNA_START=33 /DNA_END=839 /DNA_ORIENTATION=+
MRRKKHKHTRRAVGFYKVHYGFHEPYKVLLDGNFIHATLTANMGELQPQLAKLLGGRTKLYVTRCVTHELRNLGADFKQSAAAARAHELHKCGHEESPKAAADCILEQIGTSNPDHWWVATQDRAVRELLNQVPGTPVLFATVNGIHLETPSEMAKMVVKEVEEAGQALPAHERRSEALKDLEALRPVLRTNVRYRRNKAKGPNPLACKKKIKKGAPASQEPQDRQQHPGDGHEHGEGQGEEDEQKKKGRKRKRSRKPGQGGEGGGDD